MNPSNEVAVIIGAGDAIGATVGRRFARGGYTVCLVRRSLEKAAPHVASIIAAGGQAHAFSVDARDEAAMVTLFETIERDIGPIAVCLFNAGANTQAGALETSGTLFQRVWQLACFAGFVTGREAARHMLPRGRGTILFTGATASLRGGAGFAAFAAAKAGLRATAQSLAREFGPQGLHVAHVVIDGGINGERLRTNAPQRVAQAGEDGLLGVEPIAETYWQIHCQPKSAWAHEVDLRPFKEAF